MTRSILVTGANGLLGSRCVATLAADPGLRVLALWNRGVDRLIAKPPPNLYYLQCDLSDPRAVDEIFSKENIDAVLHTAALLPDANPHYGERAVAANVLATVNLADAARVADCPRFVFCSSVSVYGSSVVDRRFSEDDNPVPEDTYGWSKLTAEQYLQFCCTKSGVSTISLRLSGLHGPGRLGGIFYRAVRALKRGQPIHIPTTRVPFQFLNIDDAVASALLALRTNLDDSSDYMAINVASGVAPSLYDIVVAAGRMIGVDPVTAVKPSASIRYQVMTTDRLMRWPNWCAHDTDETLASVLGWMEVVEQDGGAGE